MIKINWIMGVLIVALFLFVAMCIPWLHEAQSLPVFALVGWSMLAAIVCIAEMMEALDRPAAAGKLPRNTRR